MRIEWLAKEGNNRLILIFAGWGTDASFYVGCLHEGWDLAVVSGYSDLSFPDDILLPYRSVAVFAWSMGGICRLAGDDFRQGGTCRGGQWYGISCR